MLVLLSFILCVYLLYSLMFLFIFSVRFYRNMTSQKESDQIGSSSGSGSTSEDQAPLWNHMTKIEKQGTKGGTWLFR